MVIGTTTDLGWSTPPRGYAADKALMKRRGRIEGERSGDCNGWPTRTHMAYKACPRCCHIAAAVGLELLDCHLQPCRSEAAAVGGEIAEERIAEGSAAIARLVKS
jgi:hypothetical protein